MTSEPIVQVAGLVVRRGGFRLEVPAWEVPAGAVVGVVGPNGAGKTTLLETVAGLRRPASGSVSVFGLDPVRRPVEVRSSLGWMAADMPVWNLRADKLLHRLSGYYPSWDTRLVADLVERFGIDLGRRPSQLSKGQGTRLHLVLAMAFRPRLLILDEPTTGLDLGGRDALMDSVLASLQDEDTSVVVSSHQLHDVARISDRLLVVDRGGVLHEGPTDELIGADRTLEEAVREWGIAG